MEEFQVQRQQLTKIVEKLLGEKERMLMGIEIKGEVYRVKVEKYIPVEEQINKLMKILKAIEANENCTSL